MAPGPSAASGFRGGGDTAGGFAGHLEEAGVPSAGADGAIVAAGFLCAFVVLFCGADADGQCVDAKRMEAGSATDGDIHSHASHREDFLEERSENRAGKEGFAGESGSRCGEWRDGGGESAGESIVDIS